MLLVTVPHSHIVLCLDNRASAWHCVSVAVCGHSAELNCGISKGIIVGRLFQTALKYEEYLLMPGRREKNVLLFIFRSSANSHADTRGSLVFKGWQRSLCTWSTRAQSSLSSARTKTALCLSHAHIIIIKPTEQRLDRQPVCWDRQRFTLSSTHLQRTHNPQTNGLVWNGNPIPCGFFKYSAIDRHFAQTIPLFNKLATVAGAANTGTISGVQSRLTFPECAAVVEKWRGLDDNLKLLSKQSRLKEN